MCLVHSDCFKYGVEADLVAMLEAIGQRLLAGIHLHRYTIEFVCLDADLVRGLAQPNHTDRRIVEMRRFAVAGNGDTDLVRYLCGHLDRKSTRLNSSHLGISY